MEKMSLIKSDSVITSGRFIYILSYPGELFAFNNSELSGIACKSCSLNHRCLTINNIGNYLFRPCDLCMTGYHPDTRLDSVRFTLLTVSKFRNGKLLSARKEYNN